MAGRSSESEPSGFVHSAQSLIVAFVIAMAFRGFIVEGYVIPTGSMGPTLMGRHIRGVSPVTGAEFPIGLRPEQDPPTANVLVDPMVGPRFAGSGSRSTTKLRPRIGDRILTVKTLYPFFSPDRFDVVVFKNPTNPQGANGNYIKRLIGLPDEAVWLVDGDVFAAPGSAEDLDAFRVQRKPVHVQRTIWQPVFSTDFMPDDGERMDMRYRGPWIGWSPDADDHRRMSAGLGGEPLVLIWDHGRRRIDDWTSYNQPFANTRIPTVSVSDIRVGAAVTPEAGDLVTRFVLVTRGHRFEFLVDATRDEAIVRFGPEGSDDWTDEARTAIDGIRDGKVVDLEFWHVDQAMSIYLDGKRVVDLAYDWSAVQRLRRAAGATEEDAGLERLEKAQPKQASLTWSFSGTPFRLERLRLDRDLHYRDAELNALNQLNEPKFDSGPAFATDHRNLGVLGPDHFLMLGDNSQASLDSRLWGSPHELVSEQIDDRAFVVNRKLLLGKAWMVYFPAPIPYRNGGANLVPDFGRLRFIR